MPTATNVTTGKPAVAGAIFVEASSSAMLPTSADSALSNFTNLGYCSEEGLTNNNSFDSNDIHEWGGAVVLNVEQNFADKFSFTLIEALNVDVLKEIFGSANVSGALATGITVGAKPAQHVDKKWVIDMIMRNNVLKRICIPAASISEVAEISYTNGDAVGYKVTLTCKPDSSGVTHYEYIKAPSAEQDQPPEENPVT